MTARWSLLLGTLLLVQSVSADVVTTSRPRRGGGGGGGGLTSPVSGEFVMTGEWTWGSADDAANACSLGETAGSIVFEGATADAFETTLDATSTPVDVTYNLPEPHASGAGPHSILTSAPQVGYFVVQDEFFSGIPTMGQLGSHGWSVGAGTFNVVSPQPRHPGIVSMSSTTSTGTIGRITFGVNNGTALALQDIQYFGCLVNPASGTTLMYMRCGIGGFFANSGETMTGVYWSFNPGLSPNWRTVTRSAATTANSTSVPYTAGTWYLLEIRRAANGSDWEFWLNGVLQFTHSTNVPAGATSTHPGLSIETLEAGVEKVVNVDWASFASLRPITGRFP